MGFEANLVLNYIKRIPVEQREPRLRALVHDLPPDLLEAVYLVLRDEISRRGGLQRLLLPPPLPPPQSASPLVTERRPSGPLNVRMP